MIHFYILLTSIGVYLSFINIYDFKRSKLNLIAYFFILYIGLFILANYFKIPPLYGLNIINAIVVYNITKKTLLTIVIPLISTILYIVVNFFCGQIVIFLTGINIYRLGNLVYLICYYLITYAIIVMVSKFLNNVVISNIDIDEFDILYKFKLYILIILTSVLSMCIHFELNIQTNVVSTFGINLDRNRELPFIYFIIFLCAIFLIMLINNQKRLKEINEYNQKLECATNEMKKFRHDYKNIMLSMCGYIESKDLDGLKKFFYSHIECLSEDLDLFNLTWASIVNIECIEVKGIIASKLIQAEKNGIKTNLYIPEFITELNFNKLDLCRILGIILDNSIEACLESNNPSLSILILEKEKSVSIVISNTYKHKVEDVYLLFEKGYSSKGEGRGMGLSNVREILKNYKNTTFNIKVEDEFIQQLDIFK
ncbi:sensor histidine kinase [Paraclostridium ghonii]|nr:GHKL domain-containing protein [Paeniclostridium ghonii]